MEASTQGLSTEYPTDWTSFVGQGSVKDQLRAKCRSAKLRGVPLQHVLLADGRPGCGKTSLALLIAQELGRKALMVSGKVGVDEARIALGDLEDGDVLIYDEIHMAVSGNRNGADWMLPLLQDGVIMGPMGPEEQPRITVIGCTTERGKLPEALLQRFMIKPVLEEYTLAEASEIAMRFAIRIFPISVPLPTVENTNAIAEACNRAPRLMRAVIGNVLDIALTASTPHVDGEDYDLTDAFGWLGLTPDGLDDTMRRYLIALMCDFSGTAGEKAMENRLQAGGGLSHCERILTDKGLIAQTSSGRRLTAAGIRAAKQIRDHGRASL